jgi:polysaccharide biosynthesis protein PelF
VIPRPHVASWTPAPRMPRSGTVAPEEPVDVALLLEGTYPFVRGGVASWVHRLIQAMPETRFAVAFLGGRRSDHGPPAFEAPPNVRHFDCQYLFEPPEPARPPRLRRRRGAAIPVDGLHRALRAAGGGEDAIDPALLRIMACLLGARDRLASGDFLRGNAAWQLICDGYGRECPEGSFADYFWTTRAMHASVFAVAELARRLPPARCYHAVSTGYAGLLGAILRHRHGRPLILTEHGIYTRERKIDLEAAEWVPGDGAEPGAPGFGRRQWLRFFQGLGTIAYASADAVIALYDGSRHRQIEDGADPSRTRVVPNGVDVERFRPLRAARPREPRPVLGFLGRVVPIKDVKGFIQAVKGVVAHRPDVEAWIVGPTSEDESYAAECVRFAATLGLEGRVRFAGFQPAEHVLSSLGLLVLTSMSEGLPLVVLEAFASGLPVVATDVGACRELVEGRTPADRALGRAGAVVPIADPEATARAALALLSDGRRWREAQRAAVRRVDAYYTERQVVDAYRGIYAEAGAWRA